MDDELKEILNEFLVETEEMIELLDQRFISLESDPTNRAMLDEIFRAMHSMKGSGGFLGFTRLVDVAHRAENILNKLRQGEMAVTPTVINVVLEAVDVVKLLVADIRESGTDVHVEVVAISAKLDNAGRLCRFRRPSPRPCRRLRRFRTLPPKPIRRLKRLRHRSWVRS